MNAARQTIRWGIPGWSLFIFFAMFITMRWIVRVPIVWITTRNIIDLRELIARYPLSGTIPSTVLALGVAGIPIGYLIYQVYFWGFWRSWKWPFVPGWVVPLDRGTEILKDVPLVNDLYRLTGRRLKELPESINWTPKAFKLPLLSFLTTWIRIIPFSSIDDWKKAKGWQKAKDEFIARRIEIDYQDNWALAGFAWYKAILTSPRLTAPQIIENQLTYMFDTYHSLGTVRVALLSAYPLYIAYDLMMHAAEISKGFWHHYFLPYCLPILVNFVVFAIWFKLLTTDRRRTLYQIIKYMRDWITQSIKDG